jgi:hypothetical protein
MTIDKNTIRRIAFFAGLSLLIVILVHRITDPDLYIEKIRKSYKGVIVKKYFLKSTHLRIRTTDSENIDIAAIGGDLLKQSAVGDTIEKIPDDNVVLLTKNGVKLKLIYVYIPDMIRQDSRWPIEWKDKWRESP